MSQSEARGISENSTSESEMDTQPEKSSDMDWTIKTGKKRRKTLKTLSQAKKVNASSQPGTSNQDNAPIFSKQSTQHNKNSTPQKTDERMETSRPPQDNHTTHQQNINRPKNMSTTMQKIFRKTYKNVYYATAPEGTTRLKLADKWCSIFPNIQDIIIQTRKGFIIKSDNTKEHIVNALNHLKENKEISSFEESTIPLNTTQQAPKTQSYSAVISQVDIEVDEKEISNILLNSNIIHRYCKRIISKKTNKPSLYIRIITADIRSYEKIINEGVYYKCRYFAVYPSHPPEPIPVPCTKCSMFTHTTAQCNTPIKCSKCHGDHKDIECKTNLPPTCTACGSAEHVAWSIKCPRRPTKPIEGIPNVKIRSINKKSAELNKKVTKNNRIHSPITIHDHIIDTYTNKINKPKNINRQELLAKIQKKFIDQYNINTIPTFVGNRLYILMFDLDSDGHDTPTEPSEGIQIHRDVQN